MATVLGVHDAVDGDAQHAVGGCPRQQPDLADQLSVALDHEPVAVELDHRVLELLHHVLDGVVLVGVVDRLRRGQQVGDGDGVVEGGGSGPEVVHGVFAAIVARISRTARRARVPSEPCTPITEIVVPSERSRVPHGAPRRSETPMTWDHSKVRLR